MALKIVGSSPIIHPIKKTDANALVFFYGMGMYSKRAAERSEVKTNCQLSHKRLDVYIDMIYNN